jgi:hypothetical protein
MELKKSSATQAPISPLATHSAFDALQAKAAILKAQYSDTRESNATLIPATLKQLFAEAD